MKIAMNDNTHAAEKTTLNGFVIGKLYGQRDIDGIIFIGSKGGQCEWLSVSKDGFC
jgi:hypothetical protein